MITTIRPTKRAVALLVSASAALLSASLLAAPAARADSSTLNVVGTSDVYDSNLIQAVIKPDFEAQNPGVTLNYISKGTGAAIAYAEQGSADALVVHAASLENQFVADGYSYEPFGRAIFWGDYVLLGPSSDPAGVLTSDSHNIAGAFEKIAAAGANGDADFVSRGGTPGTTVQEHKIWSLTNGVTTCPVSDANGGGSVPTSNTSTCSATAPAQPSWYHTTGLTQGPNVVNADACNYGNGNDCYVLTDRGTFQYLEAQNEITNLGITVRNNTASRAPGGVPLLVNSFHAYAVDPAKFPGVSINVAGAQKFLDLITSPKEQTRIGNYLAGTDDDPPFIPDAAPKLTSYNRYAQVVVNTPADIHGALTNVVPGALPLDGETVTLTARPVATGIGLPTVVQVATTNSAGQYEFRFKPSFSAVYTVSTGQITKLEDGSIDPTFSDILQPTSTPGGSVAVQGRINIYKASRASSSKLELVGAVGPKVAGKDGRLILSGTKAGSTTEQVLGSRALSVGESNFDETFAFPKGTWKYRLQYANAKVIVAGSTASHSFTSS